MRAAQLPTLGGLLQDVQSMAAGLLSILGHHVDGSAASLSGEIEASRQPGLSKLQLKMRPLKLG